MSEPEIVHPVPIEELDGWMASLRSALLGSRTGPTAEARLHNRRLTWRPDEVWGVRDRGAWVGSLVGEQRTMTVPGRGAAGTNLVAVDAVTGVSVSATHRRRGLLREMITQSQRAALERGDALSVLIAAEWPIYGRYGYAPAVTGGRYVYRPRSVGAAPSGGPPVGVRPVTAVELGDVATAVYELARRRHAGQMDRAAPWWPRELGLDGFQRMADHESVWLLREDADGRPDGLLGWHPTSSIDLDGTTGTAVVDVMAAASDEAYRELWAYLAGIDLVGEITLRERPVDEPIRWLLGDGRALHLETVVDELWLRLLDVPTALAARGYATDGRLVLDVVDTDGDGFGAGRVALEVVDGVASCEPTAADPDLRLSQRVLASAYLGGHRLRTLAITGDIEELAGGALAVADLMFATPVPPWNQTHF